MNKLSSFWYLPFVAVLALGVGYAATSSFRREASATKPGGEAPLQEKRQSLAEIGKISYNKNCITCHQATGLGMPGVYTPLVGSEWVLGNEERLIAILLHGVYGPMTVKGQAYNGAMPAWKTLKDEQLAGIATYIRSSWGNSAPEITPDQVAVTRAKYLGRTEPWTEEELKTIDSSPPSTVPAE